MWPIIKKAVNSDLSTPLNTLINNVNSIVNNVKSTVNTINTKVNTVNTNVGSKADAASATGSLHAKVAYIAANTGIKSIQRGVITLSSSEITKAATISAVTTGKAMVNLLGVRASDKHGMSSDGYPYALISHMKVTLTLTNGTTVTATRLMRNNSEAIVSYEVIEFV